MTTNVPGAGPSNMSFAIDLFDYGTPVDVAPPPASDTAVMSTP
jgi:hypothetical protein